MNDSNIYNKLYVSPDKSGMSSLFIRKGITGFIVSNNALTSQYSSEYATSTLEEALKIAKKLLEYKEIK